MTNDNITMTMFELYSKYRDGELSLERASYFIKKLDDIRHDKKISDLFDNKQDLFDIVNIHCNEIDILFDASDNYKTTALEEENKGKVICDIFFKKEGKNHLFLGRFVNVDADTARAIKNFLRNGIYAPHIFSYDYDNQRFDRERFSKLSNKGLMQYKDYIDSNIDCLTEVTCISESSDALRDDIKKGIVEAWRRNMIQSHLDYRLTAYERACEIENGDGEDERE